MKRSLIITALVLCLVSALYMMMVPTSSPGVHDYTPWYDVNDDGTIDGSDLIALAAAFGTHGQNITKAGLLYDSGWLNLTSQTTGYYTIVHNLNLSNTDSIIVDARRRDPGWNRTYGIGGEYGTSMVQTSDGGYAMAGVYYTSATGNYFLLIKTDAESSFAHVETTPNSTTLYRTPVPYWNLARLRIWKIKNP